MGEGERTRQRPSATQRWAHVLAAAVVILAAAVVIQHTLPWAERNPFGAGSAKESYRQDFAPESVAVPEPDARTAAKRPETPPAASAPVRRTPHVAALPTIEAGRSMKQERFAAGNEQSPPGKGAYQEGLASQITPMPADQSEPVPYGELERRFDGNVVPGERGAESDWQKRAREKKPEFTARASRSGTASAEVAMVRPASVEVDVSRRFNDGLDEDTPRLDLEEAAEATRPDLLVSATPERGQPSQAKRSLDSVGRLRTELKDVQQEFDSGRQAAKEKSRRSFAVDDELARVSPGRASSRYTPPAIDVNRSRQVARQYLAHGAVLDGLQFQEATGYWANTYVPGDPAMRLLEMRLSRWNRRGPGGDLRLEKAARPNWQPFDPPRNAALALYLHADQAGVQDRTRMLVQVGLKGTPRQGGLRPAMNLGLVLDLRALPADDTGTSIRALVNALHEARQPGDRFSISVAGRPGGLLVPAQAFRHGPIELAMKTLFGGEPPADNQTLDLMQALTAARSTVQASDDPTASLGTSMILLVTASSLGSQLPALERFAHHGALAGIPLSVAVLGDTANIDQIDRLVRAGQGNRRILRTPDEAAGLVQRELSAVSRVVVRAVRLRIRLAPHVKLVDVLGSRRLDTAQAQRVRQAERSIDQRMARNLGIKADRDEDEEGIQIVIPSFFAGDTHVVLLDVVAERSGFIADAQVRYKDLVFLRNGVMRTRLNLEEGEREAGPLQLRVLKNRLAMELAVSARRAGHLLANGDPQQAVAVLTWVRDLLQGMRYEIGGWSTDPDLHNDVAMVGEYLAMFGSPVIGDATERSLLADSLRYVAHRRLLSVAQ